MPTYPQRRVRACLRALGARFAKQKGRPHETVRYGGKDARLPNPHDDPLDDWLLSQILRQLGISRDDFFKHYK